VATNPKTATLDLAPMPLLVAAGYSERAPVWPLPTVATPEKRDAPDEA